MTSKEIEDICKVFHQYDKEGKGELQKEDFARVLRQLDPDGWPDEVIGVVYDSMVQSTPGRIKYEELLKWIWGIEIPAQNFKEWRAPTLKDFDSVQTCVFDCDGVIWGIPDADTTNAVAAVNRLIDMGKRVMFVTNNSNKRRADFLTQLGKVGVNFGNRSESEKLQMVVSASFTTANYLKLMGLEKPFVITSHVGILEELKLAKITEYYATITDEGKPRPEFEDPSLVDGIGDIIGGHPDVDCIVVGWDMGITARKVSTAVNYIKWHEDLYHGTLGYRQLPIIAASGDSGGVLGTAKYRDESVKLRAIGNGAMADMIARSFDPPLEWLDMGKPSDALIDMLRDPDAYDVNPKTAIMVGDTLQTDIVFGNRAGMKTLLVLSGVTTEDELRDTESGWDHMRVPTYVLPNVGALLNVLPA
jgi:HAD superfamily hydrolase (TIGR01450 family)